MNTTGALEVVWNYLTLPNDTGHVDALLVLGSYDLTVPECAAQLYHEGVAPVVVVSGSGTIHAGDVLWSAFRGRPEADVFAELLHKLEVPAEATLIENASQNTGENIHFTRSLLEKEGISFRSIRIITKPYMTRRALATAMKVWPEISWSVASGGGTVREHLAQSIDQNRVIDLIVGDVDRIVEYPQRGYILPQAVPHDVMEACAELVRAGHTRCLVRSSF